ncbi:MAG TPA: BMP family ABC transporter substrate-binding protein [Methylomirabilota bacterium]|jgi:basic membrane lipoprotein Med (substrate-binding protein (PBP1-ABC) superfamily)|nr:BMP family ABC transporter substrate-binding protein [Methylomirabilota bacterium]
MNVNVGRRLLAALAALVVIAPLAAPEAAAQSKLKVGILHVGSINDAGYNQAHAEGVQIMKKNLPEVEVIEVENVPEGADAERVMENMIKQGAKLVIPASFGYLEPALRVAQKYPDVKFMHPGGYKRAANLGTYWASTPEAFYLMGIAAGKTTKTNKLGYVVALPISFFLANVNAFELGARSVNPKAETRIVFTGTFLDPGKEATAANALLEQGVDVLGVIVDSPITVVQNAEKRGAYSVGYHYVGVQKFAPKGWISGIAFTWGNLYTRFAKQVMDGSWKSQDILGGLGDDFLTIAPFGPAVPPDAIKLVDAKKQEFINGKTQVFQGPIRDNKGVERVKAGEAFPLSDLRKMDWLVEGVIGQTK